MIARLISLVGVVVTLSTVGAQHILRLVHQALGFGNALAELSLTVLDLAGMLGAVVCSLLVI